MGIPLVDIVGSSASACASELVLAGVAVLAALVAAAI